MADRRNNKLPVCEQCTTTIQSDADSIVCEGFCRKYYHITCAKLPTEVIISCRTKPNVWWLCNHCTPLMREMRNECISKETFTGSKSTVPAKEDDRMNYTSEILELKRQIADIQVTLADSAIVKSNAETHPSLITHSPVAQSSPLSTSKLLHGTKRMSNSNITVPSDMPDDKFWLFFTKIRNDVTELDMSRMIADSLNSEASIEVKKLIPAWRNPSTMPYISFKVGVDVNLKNAALLSSTWPAGICFREFNNCVWAPPRII